MLVTLGYTSHTKKVESFFFPFSFAALWPLCDVLFCLSELHDAWQPLECARGIEIHQRVAIVTLIAQPCFTAFQGVIHIGRRLPVGVTALSILVLQIVFPTIPPSVESLRHGCNFSVQVSS